MLFCLCYCVSGEIIQLVNSEVGNVNKVTGFILKLGMFYFTGKLTELTPILALLY